MAGGGARKARKRATKRGAGGPLARIGRIVRSFLLGQELDDDASARLQEIKGLALIAVSIWLLIAMVSYYTPFDDPAAAGRNWGGQLGYYLATWIFLSIGWAGYMLVFLAIGWGGVLVARKHVAFPELRAIGSVAFLLAAAFLLQLGFGEEYVLDYRTPWLERRLNTLPYGPGGWLAMELVGPAPDWAPDQVPILVAKFGVPGLWVLLSLLALVSFMLATEMAFYPALVAFAGWVVEQREKRGEGVVRALGGWTRRLFLGLWNFVRGADLGEGMAATKAAQRGGGGTRRKAAAKKQPEPGLFDEDEEEEDDDDELVAVADEPEDAVAEEDEQAEEYDEDEEYAEDEEDEEDDEEESDEDDLEEELDDDVELAPAAAARRATKVTLMDVGFHEPPIPPRGPWKFPPLDLLEPPAGRTSEDEKVIEEAAQRLENVLRSFRVEAQVVGAKVGPTVTLFELEVVEGTRMNKVTTLSSEIAAALKARSVRVIAPIPGKSTIGIEVPNAGNRRTVRLAELVSQKAYDKKFAALPLFLGMDTEGVSVVEDLARMPHLLIAGTTGSGKSVCINTILASLLLTRSPHDVQLILVDPKMVELQMFAKVPHLMLPIVTEARQATNVLLWACDKMEGRYELFKDVGVRNIKGYNALTEEQLRERLGDAFNEERTPRHVPYIVIVVDEMADLMMVSKKEAEMAITRLAQKSRAVGIHVIVATQRPSTDVITGVLKGNLPTRIAFQVASKVDSRVILDTMGAEKLLGQGDMLYNPPQSSNIRRVQGALVEDHEIGAIVDFVCEESAPSFSQELVQAATGSRPATADGAGAGAEDDLFDEAVRIILKSKRGSASLLQRALAIGYTRASRLIDLMTAEGIVGEHKGSKAREILITLDEWEERRGSPVAANDGEP